MTSLAWAEISLEAIQHNLNIAKTAAPKAKVIATIKANAYGHGALKVAHALTEADALAVARIEEGIELRLGGINNDIIVLSGVTQPEHFSACHHHNLTAVIHNMHTCMQLSEFSQVLSVWLKVDTGMHRLGIHTKEFNDALQLIDKQSNITLKGVMSHLANAEIISHADNAMQNTIFNELCLTHGINNRSLANSAGLLFHPKMQYEWVRPGIMIYGSNPSTHENALSQQLKPAMTLKSKVLQVKSVSVGDKVGYNGQWIADKPSKIATIAIGYADGYPRHAPNGTPIYINGNLYPLVGRVSMDLITVDVSKGGVRSDDEVELWGRSLPANIIAQHAKTISYELFTGVTSRVERHYL
jgi:alanine racemase